MQSKAVSVDDYFQEIPNERKPAMTQLRELCQAQLTSFEESMTYGMPCYSRNGVVEVAFNSQKNNIALYILRKDVLDRYRALFPASMIGKGCIRYRNVDKIDYMIVKELLCETAASTGPIC